ncbi:MAG TPA: UbiA family prenyltransferase [Steroidobacteraceae bacterium]
MPAAAPLADAPVLCVALDGTLIRSNLLLESLLLLIKRNPLYLLCVPWWRRRGPAALKAKVAARVELDPAALPYDREFVAWLRSERESGRTVWLCTAANERLAGEVAAHLGLFTGVLASASAHLAGAAKAATLCDRFGERGFDYCASARRDLAVWRHARAAIIVRGSRSLARRAGLLTSVPRSFPPHRGTLRAVVQTLRPHQWVKNALLVVPLLAAHRAADPAAVLTALRAIVAFSLCASSVYVLNDLLDLQADRAHPRKSQRPFAAGKLPLSAGMALAPALLLAGLLMAAWMPTQFLAVVLAYYAFAMSYSFILKQLILIDALALAGLYTLRIIAGAAANGVPLSFWLMLFSVFLFLSLAFVKRFAELDALRRSGQLHAAGRGYHVEDLALLLSLGTAGGYLSVLILALYIHSPEIEALYRQPRWIWLLCVLLLYWISRTWMKAQRGRMHDDPVVFALKDPVSLLIGVLAAVTVSLAI